MRFTKKITSLASAIVLIINIIVLAGCGFCDLGKFESYEDYYDSFGTVSLTSESGVDEYDVEKDLYNKDVVEKMECNIPLDNYTLFSVAVKKSMSLDELLMYIKSDADCNVLIRLYKGSFDTPFYNDWDGKTTEEIAKEPQLPLKYLVEITVGCKKDEWESFYMSDFAENGGVKNDVYFESDDEITLLFLNNTAWGKALELPQCKLCVTGMMVRAI